MHAQKNAGKFFHTQHGKFQQILSNLKNHYKIGTCGWLAQRDPFNFLNISLQLQISSTVLVVILYQTKKESSWLALIQGGCAISMWDMSGSVITWSSCSRLFIAEFTLGKTPLNLQSKIKELILFHLFQWTPKNMLPISVHQTTVPFLQHFGFPWPADMSFGCV